MTPYLIYALEVQCSGLAVEVLLNGAPVYAEPWGATRFTQMKLNPWIVDGPNQLEVRLGPPPGQKVESGAGFKTLVIKGEHGKEPGPDANIVAFQWSDAEQPLAPEGMTAVYARPVPIDEGHGRWAWQDATPFTEADRDDIAALVLALHGALAARDAGTVTAYVRVKTEEYARALDVPAAELDADLRETLENRFKADDWQMDPIDPAALELRPSTDGRLVKVTDAGQRPPLRGQGEGQPYAMELTVSKLAHGWTVVR